jgi:hypothetical protein
MSGLMTTHLKRRLPLLLTLSDAEELMPNVLSETTDPVCTTAASITRPFRAVVQFELRYSGVPKLEP